jgi:hypothetical protein
LKSKEESSKPKTNWTLKEEIEMQTRGLRKLRLKTRKEGYRKTRLERFLKGNRRKKKIGKELRKRNRSEDR